MWNNLQVLIGSSESVVLLSSSQSCISKERSSNFSRSHRKQQFNVGKSPLHVETLFFGLWSLLEKKECFKIE